ncbi:MAG TPA: methyltransferase domain-containing protein [Polyangiaceae bacterium]|nr:methyltransferase domain-containing protein [Polyangiaceae bacterium]
MSPRIECDHGDRCGGCPLLGRPYEDQLIRKHARVAEAMGRYPSLAALAVAPVTPADPVVGYRTRAKLMVGPDGSIGLFAAGGGHQVVDIPRCRVVAPALAVVADRLRERVRADAQSGGALAPFDAEKTGALRAVDLREVREGPDATSARVLVTFVVERARARDLAPLRAAAGALLAAEPLVVGVAANLHEGKTPQVLGAETVTLAGAARAADRVGRSRHLATFGSFVQAHRGQTERVHELLAGGIASMRTISGPPRVLDLYGGSGAIALALAAAGARVTLVESFAPAVAQAAAAAQEQGLTIDAVCADVAEALVARAPKADAPERFDAVVVNPPRRGTTPKVREALARLEPSLVAYVSCDPDTLARDLAHLARLGYAAGAVQPIDMIPLTDEVETVALLARAPIPAAHVLHQDDAVLVVDKAPHEPTVPQGEYAGSLLARVRRIPGAEQAVPLQRPDVATSGATLFARRAALVGPWERALADENVQAVHLVAARGITAATGRLEGLEYRRLAVIAGHSILRVVGRVDPRRAPALRKRLAAIGHPVLGDDRHGHPATNRHFGEKLGLDRAFVHCVRLAVVAPGASAPLVVEAPLPGDLLAVLDRAGCTPPADPAAPQTWTAPSSTGLPSASRVRA